MTVRIAVNGKTGRDRRSGLRLRRDGRGVAALEFAIVFPVLIGMVISILDVSKAVTAARRVQNVAEAMGQMVSQTTTGSVTYVDLGFAAQAPIAVFPFVIEDAAAKGIAWAADISITQSSVVFTPTVAGCASNCTYAAKVAWSGGANPRPCNVNLTAVADSATPSPTTLPRDVFGPGSAIVVDVAYTYNPTFLSGVLPSLTFARSSYTTPRFVSSSSYVKYSVVSGDNGYASSCPGY